MIKILSNIVSSNTEQLSGNIEEQYMAIFCRRCKDIEDAIELPRTVYI